MATNRVMEHATQISAAATQPATPASGDPVIVGQLPGVALTAERADGTTTIQTDGIFNLSVQGKDSADANTTVSVGDIIYYDAAAGVKLNRDNTNGVRFGYALGALASGATGTIAVKVGY